MDLGDFDMRWAHITAVSATERQDTMVSSAQMQKPPVQHIYYSISAIAASSDVNQLAGDIGDILGFSPNSEKDLAVAGPDHFICPKTVSI